MIESLPGTSAIDDEQVVARYLQLPKFIDFLQGRLWLGRAVTMLDQLEGGFNDVYALRTLESGLSGSAGSHRINEARRHALGAFISCWTLHRFENLALWDIYAPASSGVAVLSTVGHLRESLAVDDRVRHVGKVSYGAAPIFEDSSFPVRSVDLLFHKHPSFAHEREVRFLAVREELVPPGVNSVGVVSPVDEPLAPGFVVDADPLRFVERVILSPRGDRLYDEAVRALVDHFVPQLSSRIEESSLRQHFP